MSLSVWAFPLGWLCLHALIAAACTWGARRYALARQLLDLPGERRSHQVPTPRGGGVAIVIALLVAAVVLMLLDGPLRVLVGCAAVGLSMVALIGWIDDHRPLSPLLRLAVHVLAAGLLAAGMWSSGVDPLGVVLVAGLAVVLVNVWNFMDGINGLAASQAALCAFAYALLSDGAAAVWALALGAACLGFLPFNFPRARIFLGDVGSGALGYALAVLLALLLVPAAGAMTPASWPLLLLPLATFLVDATLTLGRRMLRGEAWWRPHVQHAYQVWARATASHAKVTAVYALWTVSGAFMMLIMNAATMQVWSPVVAMMVWCLAGGLGWGYLQREWCEGRNGQAKNP